ncbi:MAG: peptide chain release factor N(5)-glutamine methyltransferase [Acidimicrobiales bacterium]|nr:peptide chain release factor N(5)-glutamine methyltransferase [Acidimicrobiales bacterium]
MNPVLAKELDGAMNDQTITWQELLAETTQRLVEAGVDEPEISARRIVEEASGWDGADLGVHLGDLATEGTVAHLDSMLSRRLTGEPLQYVVGRWAFRSLDLMVDARVLIPRPETEEVAGLAIAHARRVAGTGIPPTVADLGTGTGAIGLSIATEIPQATVYLTDAYENALAIARANTAGIGRHAVRVNIRHGSWFKALPDDLRGSFHVIVSNPPYVATTDSLPPVVADWEPATALFAGDDGLVHLTTLVQEAPDWLAESGVLVLEMAPGQTTKVVEMCLERGFSSAEVHSDLSGTPRAVVAIQ